VILFMYKSLLSIRQIEYMVTRELIGSRQEL
jgi:hypothetical protein